MLKHILDSAAKYAWLVKDIIYHMHTYAYMLYLYYFMYSYMGSGSTYMLSAVSVTYYGYYLVWAIKKVEQLVLVRMESSQGLLPKDNQGLRIAPFPLLK